MLMSFHALAKLVNWGETRTPVVQDQRAGHQRAPHLARPQTEVRRDSPPRSRTYWRPLRPRLSARAPLSLQWTPRQPRGCCAPALRASRLPQAPARPPGRGGSASALPRRLRKPAEDAWPVQPYLASTCACQNTCSCKPAIQFNTTDGAEGMRTVYLGASQSAANVGLNCSCAHGLHGLDA
jgi:hypothetical protein